MRPDIAREWTTLAYMTGERIQIVLTFCVFLCTVTCYTKLEYHTSMLTLQNSVLSRALWLPRV